MVEIDIVSELQRVQEREHRCLTDIFKDIPEPVVADKYSLFRFLVAWNNTGKPQYSIA